MYVKGLGDWAKGSAEQKGWDFADRYIGQIGV